MKLLYKIRITGKLNVMTGMHIGGSEVELVIGGVDNAVVKDKSSDIPYIPGSSLKGKLRDLLGRHFDMKDVKHDIDEVFVLFGDGAEGKHRNAGNLIVRDSFWDGSYDEDRNLEDKSENTIDRVTGKANPRHMERVVRGANFNFEMILDVYENYNVRFRVTDLQISPNKIYRSMLIKKRKAIPIT
jgi:CRISPR-associated protein Csm3